MEKYFALIKNNLIESIAVADDSFIEDIKDKYDYIIDVTNNRPKVGDSYYPDTNTFICNKTDINKITVDTSQNHLKNGIIEFEPFKLSKYDVKYSNGFVIIGCKQYSALGLLDALHKVLVEDQKTTSHFTQLDVGPTHGKFGITWDDAQMLYNALTGAK